MTKNKSTKRALLMSALALVMCVSMLVGSTFAWFTDSVTSGRNKIQSGNLDVVLEYSTDYENWAEVTASTKLFNDEALWEPGYTELVYLRVKNAGSLALKYQLRVDVYKETPGVNVYGDTFLLSDSLKIGVVDAETNENFGDFTREAAAAAAKTAFDPTASADLSNPYFAQWFGLYGATYTTGLDVGESTETALVITMPTTVGNEANHNGIDVPSIEFGINLVATQVSAESDSFGDAYDEAAQFADTWDGITVDTDWFTADKGEYTLNTAAELAGLAALVNGSDVARAAGNSFKGVTIKLGADVNLAGYQWNPIGAVAKTQFMGTFDGQGHAIFGLTPTYSHVAGNGRFFGVGFFGSIKDATIKNVHFVNATFADLRANIAGVVAGYVHGKTVFENVHVAKSYVEGYGRVGGIIGSQQDTNGTLTMIECSVSDTVIAGTYTCGGLIGLACNHNETVNGMKIIACSVENVMYKQKFYGDEDWSKNYTVDDDGNLWWLYTADWSYPAYAEYYCDLNDDSVEGIAGFHHGSKPTTVVNSGAGLKDALGNGEDVVLTEDVVVEATDKSPYGNTVGYTQTGGTIDAGGNEIAATGGDSTYTLLTYGGNILNATIYSGERGIVLYAPTEDVILHNVIIDGPGYAINTAEHPTEEVALIVSNSTLNGWTSYAGIARASFTSCSFGENSSKYWQNYGYDQDYDRLIRPYVTTTFTDCEFEKGFYIDLSALGSGEKITLTNCVCDGVVLTADNYADYITIEDYSASYVIFN